MPPPSHRPRRSYRPPPMTRRGRERARADHASVAEAPVAKRKGKGLPHPVPASEVPVANKPKTGDAPMSIAELPRSGVATASRHCRPRGPRYPTPGRRRRRPNATAAQHVKCANGDLPFNRLFRNKAQKANGKSTEVFCNQALQASNGKKGELSYGDEVPMMRLLVSPLVVRPRSPSLGLQRSPSRSLQRSPSPRRSPSCSPWRSQSRSPWRSPSRSPWRSSPRNPWTSSARSPRTSPARSPQSGAAHSGSHDHSKPRKLRSAIWKDMDPIYQDGKVIQGRCKHCYEVFAAARTSGTSHMRRHLETYEPRLKMHDLVEKL